MPADTEITEGCHGLLSSRFLITYRGNEIGNTPLHGRLIIHQTQGSIGVAHQGRQDEDFFQQYGVAEGGVDGFRDEVRGNMEKELEQAINNRLKAQVMDGLLASNQVELPGALVTGEIDKLRQEAIQQFGGQNAGNIDASLLPSEMFQKQAEKRVALGLLVGEVLKRENLEADGDRVRAMIEKMASSYEDPDQVVKWYYSNEQQLNQVRNLVLEEQVIEQILGEAKVTEVESTYEEAIKPPAQEAETEEESEGQDDAK